jgi:hypothetical protein
MEPIKFKESNKTLQKPESMTDEECLPLEVFTNGNECISKWKFSFKERIRILFGCNLWIYIFSGQTQPPIAPVIDWTVFEDSE